MKNSLFILALMTFLHVSAGPGNEALSYLDKALKANVSSEGVVNYSGLKSDANFVKAKDLYSNMLPQSTWTKNEKMSFWINVYNVFTIQLILDNYPVASINDIKEPWDKKFISLNGEMYSLNQIEHEILRPQFNDPRVHFAVNCASLSCPKLHFKAFRAETLDSDLNKLTRGFLNDPERNELGSNEVKVSKIFSWFQEDFTKGQSLLQFINKYSDQKISENAKVSYLEYNWNLND